MVEIRVVFCRIAAKFCYNFGRCILSKQSNEILAGTVQRTPDINDKRIKRDITFYILCFETEKLFFPLNSGEKLEHSNNWTCQNSF